MNRMKGIFISHAPCFLRKCRLAGLYWELRCYAAKRIANSVSMDIQFVSQEGSLYEYHSGGLINCQVIRFFENERIWHYFIVI